MAVQFYNGQLYDVYSQKPNMTPSSINNARLFNPQYNDYSFIDGLGWAMPVSGAGQSGQGQSMSQGMFGDPFGSAMSGNQAGALQPYVNRMTQKASDALYGGLLNYSPTSMVAGNAGGTPQNSTVPQFNLQSAIPQGLLGQFGNRSWMKG